MTPRHVREPVETVAGSTGRSDDLLAYETDGDTLHVHGIQDAADVATIHQAIDRVIAETGAEAVHLDRDVADGHPINTRCWTEQDTAYRLPRSAFYQLREGWLSEDLWPVTPRVDVEPDRDADLTRQPDVPVSSTCSMVRTRHPRRPRLPEGRLYRRPLPATGETFELHRATVEDHLELLSAWLDRDYVAEVWGEYGSLDEVRESLVAHIRNPHVDPLIGSVDGTPFLYVEVYWAKEDRVAPYCDPGDYDQGFHFFVGDPDYLGGERTAAWMRATTHFMFLREPRTRRLVVEPDADNDRAIDRLLETGWLKQREFDFPHKRAALLELSRERFFEEVIP